MAGRPMKSSTVAVSAAKMSGGGGRVLRGSSLSQPCSAFTGRTSVSGPSARKRGEASPARHGGPPPPSCRCPRATPGS
eukprot:436785-Pyramimonas_sp.AAC.1